MTECNYLLLFLIRKSKCIIIFFLCTFLYFTYELASSVYRLDLRRDIIMIQIRTNDTNERNEDNSNDNFLINTSQCKIPRGDIINNRILPLMNITFQDKTREPYCHYFKNRYKPPLIASDGNTLRLIQNSVKFYTKSRSNKIKCYYRPFWKGGPDDGRYIRLGKAIHFINFTIIPPTVEFTRVRCKVKRFLIYEDYHAFIPQKRPFYNFSAGSHVNVLVYGMDSLSRVNFHRQMPLTKQVLQKLNFIEYFGYNKVADNTFPNLIPLLTGYTISELRSVCWRSSQSYFDKCPFIWRKYEQFNYTSALIEEQSYLSMFRFKKSGFINSPTDYYYYTFDRAATEAIAHTAITASNFCLGSRPSAQILLDYCTKLISTLKNSRLFSFMWQVSLSHDDLNLPRISDPIHRMFFTSLHDLNVTETSVIIFMSDHGIRHGEILEMLEGYLEERLPLFTVSFPSWFSHKYPLAYANFKANSKRLTTHFDTYEMLNDLVDLNNIEDHLIRKRTTQLNQLSKIPRGISLFLPIPETRTCSQAGVHFFYCTCMRTMGNAKLNTSSAKRIAKFFVAEINRKVEKYNVCAKLELKKVKSIQFVKIHDRTDFMLVSVLTRPGNGIFQALIRKLDEARGELKIDGDITRMNKYGNQSRCMNEPEIKLYCYCI